MPELTTRDVTEQDFDQALGVRSRSFGPLVPGTRDRWEAMLRDCILARRMIGVYDGDRLVAHARVRGFEQAWGGRHLPMGGVAGVVVDPDQRGRGVGTLLMRSAIERMAELGDAVSVLYPAHAAIYRGCGYEFGGAQHKITFDSWALRDLRHLGRSVDVRRALVDDAEQIRSTIAADHARLRADGPLLPAIDELRSDLEDPDQIWFVAGNGCVSYRFATGKDLLAGELVIDRLHASDPTTRAALWSLVGSGSSVARTVAAYVAPDDPIHLLTVEQAAKQRYAVGWMLRVIDLPTAIEKRGFASAVNGFVDVLVEDELAPGCAGPWRITVADGAAHAVRADVADPVRMGPRGLAGLYAGLSPARLREAGLLEGGLQHDALLEGALGGAAYLLDYF